MSPKSIKGITIGLLIVLLIIIGIYAGIMFYLYSGQKFIFKAYVPPDPPAESYPFYPLGSVTPLSQADLDHRNDIINASANVAS